MAKSIAAELKDKIALDASFQKKLVPIFNSMIKEFTKQYKKDGTIVNVEIFEKKFDAAILAHYKKVANKFAGIAQDELDIEPVSKTKKLFNLALLIFQKESAKLVAEEITKTNQKRIEKAIDKAKLVIAEALLKKYDENSLVSEISGAEALSQEQEDQYIALFAGIFLARQTSARAKTIAMTETQHMAEGTKFIEACALTNTPNPYLDMAVDSVALGFGDSPYVTDEPSAATKEWQSILSPNTRSFHAEAHGQRTQLDGYFFVNGEYLKYPGDISMGASAKNTVNCYCRTRYSKEL